MNSKTELQAEFEAAKPGYGFAKLPDGSYLYEGIQAMFNDWLEKNELRKARLRITELEAAKKDAERLDWIIDNTVVRENDDGFTLTLFALVRHEDVRLAIDAAIQAEGTQA